MQRCPCGLFRAARNNVCDGFCLRKVELVVEERALGELAWLGLPACLAPSSTTASMSIDTTTGPP
jgi:hypothetical protein